MMSKLEVSERGFKQGEKKTDLDMTTYHICESSLATEPAIRLYIDEAPHLSNNDSLHLSLEQARQLAEDLLMLCSDHYQIQDQDKEVSDEH